ncbi:MAG TPA: phospholipase D-like domain-containing protein [Urbifossiella sp.]|jgi:phosphatidylserine/phosphatidylglycerophosphate/cardiolipin synthase-like enzyme|nr:phospholipase D-like domain-containing protein [Urbifossiella sp.]
MPEWLTPDARSAGWIMIVAGAGLALHIVRHLFHREPAVASFFSPKGGCAAAVVAEVNAARREVLVMAYSFTCPDIVAALIAAARRRVRVVILLDRSNETETYSELGDLERHKMEVWIDASHAIAHNKVIVIDGRVVVTGSFNFTRQAEHENAENLLILRDHPGLAARYRENFHAHKGHCHAPGARQPAKPPHIHDRGHAHSHRVA